MTTSTLHKIYIGVVLILVLGTGLLWNSRENQRKELETLKASVSLQQSLSETKAQLDGMLQRQKELYPVLQKTWDDLRLANDALEKRKKEIKLIERKQIQNELEKMDNAALSSAFSELGFSNSAIGISK